MCIGASVAKVRALSASETGGNTGEVARLGPGGFEIATLSAGGVLAGVEAVAPPAIRQSATEGMEGHRRAAALRLNTVAGS